MLLSDSLHGCRRNRPWSVYTQCCDSLSFCLYLKLPVACARSSIKRKETEFLTGFALYKGAFWDVLALQCNWLSDRMPTRCACNEPFTVEHALSCPEGTFPIHHHNEIRDITCSLLSEVSHDVTLEPTLQPLDGHALRYASAITDDGARADIQAFWGNLGKLVWRDPLEHDTDDLSEKFTLHLIHDGAGIWLFVTIQIVTMCF